MEKRYKDERYCEKCYHKEIHSIYEREVRMLDGKVYVGVIITCDGCGFGQINFGEKKPQK